MRMVFLVGSIFVALAGVQLYVLADSTDRFFAWTISIPLTAAFLGAYYWTALVLSFLSWRERRWVNARVGVFGVFVFLLLTLTTTLVNLDQFHLDKGPWTARAAAWAWLVIYILDPILVAVAIVLQLRARPAAAPRRHPFASWYRIVLALSAGVSVGVGVALFAAPQGTSTALWPWPLTALTARAVAAWLIGAGIILASMAYENDYRRTRSAAAAFAVLGVLQLLALGRYHDTLDWTSTATWLYVAFFTTAIGVGANGLLQARRSAGAPATP